MHASDWIILPFPHLSSRTLTLMSVALSSNMGALALNQNDHHSHYPSPAQRDALAQYERNYFESQRELEAKARLQVLESRMINCEDSALAMGSRLDFIQADVSSTRTAMQELIAMIKRTASEAKESDSRNARSEKATQNVRSTSGQSYCTTPLQ